MITKYFKVALLSLLSATMLNATSNISYQGVAFDNNATISNQNIALRFTILASDGSTVIHQETVSNVLTTAQGFFSHQIGSGTRVAGSAASYEAIPWVDDYKLKVEADYANGTSYTNMGTQDFTTTPYAKQLEGSTLYVDRVNNRIGIGTQSPRAALEVYATNSAANMSSLIYFNNSGATFGSNGVLDTGVSIFAEGHIMSATGAIAASDERIKTDITPIINSLDIIKKLRPVHYGRKDKVESRDAKFYGFIAQEVEKVIPEAVTKSKGDIPVLKPFDKVTFEDGVVYRILVKNGDDIKEQKYTTKELRPTGEIIVKSKEVDDFRALSYDTIFTVAVDAIQEQQEEIQSLKSELISIKKALADNGIKIK